MVKKAEVRIFKTIDICRLYDISRSTLFRWESEGFITDVERDWRGWRLYHQKNLKEIERLINRNRA